MEEWTMGYIVPFNHYQYNQYAVRDLDKKQDPFRLYPVSRVNRVENDTQWFQPEQLFQFSRPAEARYSEEKPARKVNEQTVERVYGDMTGKGTLFSESV
ncbi:hypothetical protein LCM00_08715 [Bacillus infantis]|uniref:hypothetical protein n=1 Tax=Bacillus infantis TaxID=324767 RepID=UPI001CD72E78|nr:hypothetical protein [Bacillus infantis]MCA1039577.1 hypothetical protein [Bacillus infantis]